MSGAQSGQAVFQLMNTLAATASANGLSGSYSNTFHEVWYLLGYPDATKAATDAGAVNAALAGGTSQTVTIKAAQKFAGLRVQPGVWVLARIPTILEIGTGGLALDPNLITDGFLRLAYDATTNGIAITRFHHVTRLEIYDSNGVLLFDNAPVPGGLPLLIPTGYNPNNYTPSAVHFDGSTGLVTTDVLATNDTGIISFAGWFKLDPSLTGQLEFSQGSGDNKIFWDTPILPDWFHAMGTIDAGAGVANLLINGELAPGNPINTGGAFSSAPTNGKPFYIGTDTQGNFFKGDIADLSIWFDSSFFFAGVIPGPIRAKFVNVTKSLAGVVSIEPVHPFITIFGRNIIRESFRWDDPDLFENLERELLPDIFLAGPASKLYGHAPIVGANAGLLDIRIQELADLKTDTGTLTNAGTAPGQIVIVPT